MPCSAAYLRTSSVIFIEQKCGPHMEQKWAVLAPSCGRVSSWNSRAGTGDVAVTRVNHLRVPGPGAPGEFALHLEFAELRLVIGVRDGAGAQAVADAEGHVVGGHDVADVVPVGVEEVLLVMREAPLGHDA